MQSSHPKPYLTQRKLCPLLVVQRLCSSWVSRVFRERLDRCFKRRYTSKTLEIGELLKVQDHRICRKVSSIPNHPLRANFPETKTTRYNLRNKSPAMPAINTDRFKNTLRIVFKYNVALRLVYLLHLIFVFILFIY